MNAFIINVDDIEESGQPFEADLTRESIDEVLLADPPTEFHAVGAALVKFKLTRLGRKVLAQSTFKVPIEGQCKRCLKPIELAEPVDMTLTYVPLEGVDPQTSDEEGYNGKQLDLWPALREQILLSVPPSPLCREDCKGLCDLCGKDLNEGDCGHDRKMIDPRWQALKAVQLETKKEK